ncbi:MAG: asparagine synthase (glutamine-hydrolyzing) [Geobacteraceae bacterium]|nr:asparagine synthase (glutamine-hydrolyzing) [Geobacteraceae bacterium]
MCGITGIFSFGDAHKVWPAEELSRNIRAVRHRGPDGEGRHVEPGLFLGHARLAVIDLSTDAGQPMHSADGRFVLTYNGEIYNFRELRHDLERLGHGFRTRSDTEVLLASWQEWGEKALDRLDGMFAFALFDRQERALYLVRDQIGIKPLFYNLRGGDIFFASELLALFGPLNPCPEQDAEDLDRYFTFNYLPAPGTGLQGVCQLEAGCLLRVDAAGLSLKRYWSPAADAAALHFNPETVGRFSDALNSSVNRQTVADVPLGVFLSGGLDSYSVALAAAAGGHSPEAFTLGFAEAAFDESAAAECYARHLQIRDHLLTFAWDVPVIERTLAAMGELLADASCFPLYQLSSFARQRVTVILAGDGADELLAGYGTYRAGDLTPLIRKIPAPLRRSARSLVRRLPLDDRRYGVRMVAERLLAAAEAGPLRDHASFRRIFGDDLKQRLYSGDLLDATAATDPVGEYAAVISRASDGGSYLAACQIADLQFHLPGILAKVDRMSMAHGLEVRVPLLGKEMVSFCLGLGDDAKRTLGQNKRILRAALEGKIPPGALRRPKAGFLPPVDSWFRGDGPMSTVFGDLIVTARGKLTSLRWDQVERYWQEHRGGSVDGGFVLLGITQYINWSLKCRSL